FLAPVPAGARVRLRVVLTGVEPREGGQATMKTQNTLEIEGAQKPALIAETLALLNPGETHGETMSTEHQVDTEAADNLSDQASRHTLALNPLVGLRGTDLLDSAGILVKAMLNEPRVAIAQWLSFLGELTDIVGGKSERTPQPGDKRFSD